MVVALPIGGALHDTVWYSTCLSPMVEVAVKRQRESKVHRHNRATLAVRQFGPSIELPDLAGHADGLFEIAFVPLFAQA